MALKFLLRGLSDLSIMTDVLGAFTDSRAATLSGYADEINNREQADSDRFDAIVAEEVARAEMEGAEAEAFDFRRAQSARAAASRAASAGSGFKLEGSPMLVNEAALAQIEVGAGRILQQGAIRAHRLKQQAEQLRRRAVFGDINAGLARSASRIDAFSPFVSLAGRTAETLASRSLRASVSTSTGPLDIRPPLLTSGGFSFGI